MRRGCFRFARIGHDEGREAKKLLQAAISSRLLSSRSPRRYAASVLSLIVWARACSQTSRGKLVRSDAQSRNAERNPCAVDSIPIRRNAIRKTMLERGFFAERPGKIYSESPAKLSQR